MWNFSLCFPFMEFIELPGSISFIVFIIYGQISEIIFSVFLVFDLLPPILSLLLRLQLHVRLLDFVPEVIDILLICSFFSLCASVLIVSIAISSSSPFFFFFEVSNLLLSSSVKLSFQILYCLSIFFYTFYSLLIKFMFSFKFLSLFIT